MMDIKTILKKLCPVFSVAVITTVILFVIGSRAWWTVIYASIGTALIWYIGLPLLDQRCNDSEDK